MPQLTNTLLWSDRMMANEYSRTLAEVVAFVVAIEELGLGDKLCEWQETVGTIWKAIAPWLALLFIVLLISSRLVPNMAKRLAARTLWTQLSEENPAVTEAVLHNYRGEPRIAAITKASENLRLRHKQSILEHLSNTYDGARKGKLYRKGI